MITFHRLLASHNILNVRNVGGTFRMTPELAQTFRSTNFEQNFDVATVVLSDRGDQAAAYMVGWTHDGQYDIRSLQNIARPNDLDRYIDRIQARINAHGYRETFRHSAILMRNERSSGFYPERYVDRPSALEPLGRSTTPSPV